MNDADTTSAKLVEPAWLSALVRAEPRAPLMFPYLVYLLLLAFQDRFAPVYLPWFIAAHALFTGYVCRLFRPHFPPMGKWHWGLSFVVGIAAAVLWVAGHYGLMQWQLFGYRLGDRLPFYPGETTVYDPTIDHGEGAQFWFYVSMKITRAVLIVPIVEELLWRGFLLRAFVSWDRYDEVPAGQFHWRAFLGTALLSTVQHPDQWGVSILCWLAYNGLFYWTKSLRCLMATHGITNLALYLYVIRSKDWQFW